MNQSKLLKISINTLQIFTKFSEEMKTFSSIYFSGENVTLRETVDEHTDYTSTFSKTNNTVD